VCQLPSRTLRGRVLVTRDGVLPSSLGHSYDRCGRVGSTRAPLDELCVCDGIRQTLVAISVVVIPVSTSNDRQLRHQTELIGFRTSWSGATHCLKPPLAVGVVITGAPHSSVDGLMHLFNSIAGICTLAHTTAMFVSVRTPTTVEVASNHSHAGVTQVSKRTNAQRVSRLAPLLLGLAVCASLPVAPHRARCLTMRGESLRSGWIA
jgi:hypothetical protein